MSATTSRAHNFIDLTGQPFNRLTVQKLAPVKRGRRLVWICVCECGKITEAVSVELKSGHKKSCGCLRQDTIGDARRTHGKSKTRIYNIWSKMIARCHNSNSTDFYKYGQRRIFVCRGWRESSDKFMSDMGEPPTRRHSIDRIDNSRGYDCGSCDDCVSRQATPNCRWATAKQQARNTSKTKLLTHNGESLPMAEWAERMGVRSALIHRRLSLGWSVSDAITKPKRCPQQP